MPEAACKGMKNLALRYFSHFSLLFSLNCNVYCIFVCELMRFEGSSNRSESVSTPLKCPSVASYQNTV